MEPENISELIKLLTSAEQRIVTQLFLGKTNREIGTALGICEKTVKGHLTSVYRKSGCYSDRQILTRFRSVAPQMQPERQELRDDEYDEPGTFDASELVPPA